ncbi:MAG: winged helix DNA-binding domain-containing protein [Dermatophilaceae bacterium]
MIDNQVVLRSNVVLDATLRDIEGPSFALGLRVSDLAARVTVMVRAPSARAVERERDDRRLAAQLLVGPPADSVVQVVDRLLAVQAQDLRAARLAVRSRTSGLTASDVDRELNNRTLVVAWLNRGTLHLVRPQDYWWLQRLTTPQLATGNAKRLEQEGVSPSQADRGVAVIEAAIAANGPMTRAQLREIVRAADVPVAGQALVHILFLSALRGLTVRGPVIGREQGFVLVRDWLRDPPKATDRDTALSELARRFLAGHGPAGERDLAKWAGITLGDARRGLRAAGSDLEERPGGLVDLAARPAPSRRRRPKLLGGFDPLLHGWVDREPVLAGNQTIVTMNGIFKPFALVGGRAVATWRMPGGRVRLEPFGNLSATVLADLGREARDVERFLAPH